MIKIFLAGLDADKQQEEFVPISGYAQVTNSTATFNDSITVSNGMFAFGQLDATLHIEGLLEFASNNDALAAGLTDGAVYRNGDQLCMVHQ